MSRRLAPQDDPTLGDAVTSQRRRPNLARARAERGDRPSREDPDFQVASCAGEVREATRSLAPGFDAAADGAAFAHELWRVGAAHVTGGNAVRVLRDGPIVFETMLSLIERAERSVGLESYIVRADEVGERFGAALSAAAARGVSVRLVADWLGSRDTPRAFFSELRHAGVDVAIHNRPGLRRPWLGIVPRDHRKLLVVDAAAGVIGGIGLGHEWTHGARANGERWRDTAVLVRGPAGRDMQGAFERSWCRATRSARLDSAASLPGPPDLATAAPALVGIVEGEPGRLRVSRALQLQAALAERTVWIADAYFMPSFAELEALTGAARDGVDVRLLLPGRNDHAWMVRLTRRYYRRLLASGVRIWEWQGEMMHAKTSVVDGRYTRVGSTDFNPLGVAINFELDAVVDDARLGADAEALFLDDLDGAREVRASVPAG
jgi:cardiolipin synthase